MSKPATAEPGRRYKTPHGHVVMFQGPSRRKGFYQVLVIDTERIVDVPADHPLFPVDEAALAAKASVDAIAGKPREVLQPAIPTLTDEQLDALAAADTRMWVQQEILLELGRRRDAKTAAPATPAPVVEEEVPPPFPEAASVEDLSPPAAAPPYGPEATPPVVAPAPAPVPAVDPSPASAPTPTDAAVPEPEMIPDSGARSSAFMAGRDAFMAGRPWPEAWDKGNRIERDYDDFKRGWDEAHDLVDSEPQFVKRVDDEAVDTHGVPGDSLAPDATPPAEPPAKAKRQRKAKATPVASEVQAPVPPAVTPTEPAPAAAPASRAPAPSTSDDEVRGWLSTALRMVREGEGTVQEVEDRLLDAVEARPGMGEVLEVCMHKLASPDRTEATWARIERAIEQAIAQLPPVDRAAEVGAFDAAVDRAQAEAKAQRAENDARAEVPAEVAQLAEERLAEVRQAAALPTETAAFLTERLDVVDGATLERFDALVGSVRAQRDALVGVGVDDLPLLESALEWERAHANRAVLVRELAGKVERLRGGRARPGVPHAAHARLAVPAGPTLSPEGQARAASIQEALNALAVSVPGYLAAVEARERLIALGFPVDLATIAGGGR